MKPEAWIVKFEKGDPDLEVLEHARYKDYLKRALKQARMPEKGEEELKKLFSPLTDAIDAYLDDEAYFLAFDLSYAVFEQVFDQPDRMAERIRVWAASQFLDVCHRVIGAGDTFITAEILNSLLVLWDVNDPDEERRETVEDVLGQLEPKVRLDAKLKVTLARAEWAHAKGDPWLGERETANWILAHLGLLEEKGVGEDRLEACCRRYWKYTKVRDFWISHCFACKDMEGAIRALKESLEMGDGGAAYIRSCKLRLKDAYRQTGRTEDYVSILRELFLAEGDVELFKELKALCREDEWEKTRAALFAALPPQAPLDRLYFEEGLFAELGDYLEKRRSLRLINQYAPALVRHTPERVFGLYEDIVADMAKRASNRPAYREVAGVIGRVKRLEGGAPRAKLLSERLMKEYPRKRALVAELLKI